MKGEDASKLVMMMKRERGNAFGQRLQSRKRCNPNYSLVRMNAVSLPRVALMRCGNSFIRTRLYCTTGTGANMKEQKEKRCHEE